ncbi:MAG: FHA domain-containing protein [Kiritimatiellae bacterium]|nr:FHA domain-containing protein [Kiritimatiellia bacterium]
MKLRFERDGKKLYEIAAESMPGELIIGRSAQCDWQTPKEERKVSGQHASIFREGEQLFIKDLGSKNGTFFAGERITKRALQAGDRIEIGGCSLIVGEEAAPSSVSQPPVSTQLPGRPPPQLIGQTGALRGRKFVVAGSPFVIGSDPGLSLSVPDSLVSRRHAEINVAPDGRCRIRDLGSTNKTAVNGHVLAEGEEAELNKGDRVRVAHYTLLFDDGTGLGGRKNLYVAGGAAAALLVLLVLVLRACNPPAERLIGRARHAAAAGRFDDARAALGRAEHARRAESHRAAREALLHDVQVWDATAKAWQGAVDSLARGDWDVAAGLFKQLAAKDPRAWGWDEEARETLPAEAGGAGALLSAYLAARDAVGRGYLSSEEVGKRTAALRNAVERCGAEPPAYLAALLDAATRVRSSLADLVDESKQFARLDGLLAWPPEAEQAVTFLAQMAEHGAGAMKQRAGELLGPVKAIAAALAQYRAAVQALSEVALHDARRIQLSLPSPELCAKDPRVAEARTNIQNRHASLLQAVTELERISALSPKGLLRPEQVAMWQAPATLENVFACDSLSRPPPPAARREPAGEYDRYLGIEDFFGFYMELSGRTQLRPLKTPFRPLVPQSKEYFARVNSAIQFMDAHKDADWQRGELAAALADYRKQIELRDRVVADMLARAERARGREALIAAGIAMQLAEAPDKLLLAGRGLRDWAAAAFAAHLTALRALGRQYEEAAGEHQRAECAAQILREGLPGSPTVTRVWAESGVPAVAREPAPPEQVLSPQAAQPPDPRVPEREPAAPDPRTEATDSGRFARQRTDLLAKVSGAETAAGLLLVVNEFEQWENGVDPPPADEASRVEKAISEKYAALADAVHRKAAEAYEALRVQDGDVHLKALKSVVTQASDRYGRADLATLVTKTERLAKQARLKKTGADRARLQQEQQAQRERDAAAAAAAAEQTGTLQITTTPGGADIYVDGTLIEGNTVQVSAQVNHKVRIELDGYKPHEQHYRVRAGQTKTVDVLLQKESGKKSRWGR